MLKGKRYLEEIFCGRLELIQRVLRLDRNDGFLRHIAKLTFVSKPD